MGILAKRFLLPILLISPLLAMAQLDLGKRARDNYHSPQEPVAGGNRLLLASTTLSDIPRESAICLCVIHTLNPSIAIICVSVIHNLS